MDRPRRTDRRAPPQWKALAVGSLDVVAGGAGRPQFVGQMGPIENGQAWSGRFQTSQGLLDVNFDVSIRGGDITLRNLSVFPQNFWSTAASDAARLEPGPREMLSMRSQLVDHIRAQVPDGRTVTVEYDRITGANAGRDVSLTMDMDGRTIGRSVSGPTELYSGLPPSALMEMSGIRTTFGTAAGRGGLATAVGITALNDTREWRDENLPATVNAGLNTVTDAVDLATRGPLPVFPVGTLVHDIASRAMEPYVGETAAKYLGFVPAVAADIKATALTGGAYGWYNLGAAAGNVLANSQEDPAVRAARFEEAQQYKYWENKSYDWAAARGDQNFTLGDAHRTATEMVNVMNQPAGAGLSVFTPDGQSYTRIDADYANAMSGLVSTGQYGADYLGNYTPQEVVGMYRDHVAQQQAAPQTFTTGDVLQQMQPAPALSEGDANRLPPTETEIAAGAQIQAQPVEPYVVTDEMRNAAANEGLTDGEAALEPPV